MGRTLGEAGGLLPEPTDSGQYERDYTAAVRVGHLGQLFINFRRVKIRLHIPCGAAVFDHVAHSEVCPAYRMQ